tara:strand:- start:288 stop:2615 length:2328 start_codon:yes stop_codon:yes gene_type:complete
MTDTNQPQPHSKPFAGPLDAERVLELLKGSQRIVLAWAKPNFDMFLSSFNDKLLELCDRGATNQEQRLHSEFQHELLKQGREFSRYFCGYLGEGFIKFRKHELDTHTGEEKYTNDILSLVDNEDLEQTIAISSITQREENKNVDLLWALNQRYAVLNGGHKVFDRSNPIGPVQFCESLRKALKLFNFDTKVKIIAYKVFDEIFMQRLQEVLDENNNYLQSSGVLANLRQAVMRKKASPTTPAKVLHSDGDAAREKSAAAVYDALTPSQNGLVAAPDPNQSSEQYQGSLVNAIHTLQSHIALGVGSRTDAPPVPPSGIGTHTSVINGTAANHTYSRQQLISVLQNLQLQVGPLPVSSELTGQSVIGLNGLLTQHFQVVSKDTRIESNDMHTIDLVGMLFEYMLSDENLPDSIKTLLSYLHTPFMKIAFLDKSFFTETEHPARLLLNSLAEAGVRWVSNDGTSQYDMYEKIKSVVSRVLQEFKDDVRIFAELLLDFSGYTKKLSRRQELMERRVMEKLEGEEKLREVKFRVNTEVRSRSDKRELPSAVLLLLLQPWSDYLAFVLLRYGDKSEAWAKSIKTIDLILWSVECKTDNAQKSRQMEIHDELLDSIETGFETIGYDPAKAKKLLEALISLQKLALLSKSAEVAPVLMRNKLEALAAEKVGHNDDYDEQPSEQEAKIVESLKMIEFGTWFEFEGGKRLKVAWYNARTLHYMLVDQMGKKVAMKSGLQLARAMICHETKIIAGSSKPFFERALENIFVNLNTKATKTLGDRNHG